MSAECVAVGDGEGGVVVVGGSGVGVGTIVGRRNKPGMSIVHLSHNKQLHALIIFCTL